MTPVADIRSFNASCLPLLVRLQYRQQYLAAINSEKQYYNKE